jgi:hypothetical protein
VISQVLTDVLSALDSRDRGLLFSVLNLIPLSWAVVETCRRLKIPIRDYLGLILLGLANFPNNRIAELTPAAWLARN